MYGRRVIDHFGINCADWESSKAFYDTVLGALGYTRQLDYQVAGPSREIHVAFQAVFHGAAHG